jgi:hypothetical protein
MLLLVGISFVTPISMLLVNNLGQSVSEVYFQTLGCSEFNFMIFSEYFIPVFSNYFKTSFFFLTNDRNTLGPIVPQFLYLVDQTSNLHY